MNQVDLAWLAGLLEGEGSFKKPAPSAPRLPLITAQMTDKDVVEHAAHLMGVGVCSFTSKNPKHKPTWVVSLKGAPARRLMVELRPLMGQRRRQQIDAALAVPYRQPGDGPKLTLDQAREIKRRAAAGERVVAIAAEYNVSKWLVYRIKEGKRAS